ncbi:hypothetical protein HETIRDRAFT_109180 [Heterobasidion irregulare TC 32-1]|uniref:Uncharacterized protein n=1 Tax=Heterobasidion irregulare (strain TC 32-1) TaxID=747525 RepID=W4KDV3_HETIT|nr:uncharacterized protein HETIRDRAFT_109180 [Heterobasidion irregulare TC 32-1]ETW83495.1 hypothetical protein HETIRDRAFT_109180 [Heterobasidion irregulare TC 32-1]
MSTLTSSRSVQGEGGRNESLEEVNQADGWMRESELASLWDTLKKRVEGSFKRMSRITVNCSTYSLRERSLLELLREKTQQPGSYLREFFNEIGFITKADIPQLLGAQCKLRDDPGR